MRKIELTEEQKKQILIYHQAGRSASDIANEFGISKSTMSRIIKNELGINVRKAPPKIGDIINGWEIIDIYQNFDKEPDGKKIAKIRNISNGGDVTRDVRLTNLTNGIIGSADIYEDGVIKNKRLAEKNKTHGKSKTRLYRIWRGMRNRCENEKCKKIGKYGELDISVHKDWQDFLVFEEWALSNGYGDELSLDRKDTYGDYEPSNCRWATRLEQARNRTNTMKLSFTAFNETKTFQEWANDPRCLVLYSTLMRRIVNGWEGERALTEASKSKNKTKMNLKNWLKFNHRKVYDEYFGYSN